MKHIRNPFIGYILFILFFLLRRIPFFLSIPVPFIGRDTLGYYFKAEALAENFFIPFGIYPPGYPAFISFIHVFTTNPFWVILVQVIITLIISLYVLHLFYKYYPSIALLLCVTFIAFTSDTLTVIIDFSLLPDCLYRNSLVLIFAFTVLAIKENKAKFWGLLSTSIMIAAAMRSNGIYAYFIIFLTPLYFMRNSQSKSKYYMFLLPFLMINILWSTYSLKADGIFLPGNTERIYTRLKLMNKTPDEYTWKNNSEYTLKNENENKSFLKYRLKLMKENVGSAVQDRNEIYTYYATSNFENLYLDRNTYFNHQSIEAKLFSTLLADYNTLENKHHDYYNKLKTNNLDVLDHLNIFYNKIHNILFSNYIWVFIFYSSFLAMLYLIIRFNAMDKELFILTITGLIHVLAVIVIALAHYRTLPRYIHVSEFAIYLFPIIFIHYIRKLKTTNFKLLNK